MVYDTIEIFGLYFDDDVSNTKIIKKKIMGKMHFYNSYLLLLYNYFIVNVFMFLILLFSLC